MLRSTIRLASLALALSIPAQASLQYYAPALPLGIKDDAAPTLAEGGLVSTLFDCQPRLFNPKTAKLSANPDGTYAVEGWDHGWVTKKRKTLKKPYSLTEYTFTCQPNIVSQVLELTKDGRRFGLYTHVVRYAFSPDQKFLYLDNYIELRSGQWKRRHRIIDLAAKKVTSLPHAHCTLSHAAWSMGRLVTHASTAWGDDQSYCVWEPSGTIAAILRGNLLQSANDERVVAPHGLLPKEPDTFWAVHTNFETQRCTLILQQLKGARKQRSLDLGLLARDIGACSWDTMEIDMTKATFAKSPVRFRTRANAYAPWSSWR